MRVMMRNAAVAGAAALLVANASPALATDAGTGWLPWLGCWQPVETIADPERPLVCFVPTSDAGTVEVITLEGGEIASRERMSVDGSRRDVEDGGCSGWETASWSADGRRIYTRSELACEGLMRRGTGMIAMASPSEWLDIQAVAAGDDAEPALRVIRYRAASAAPLEAAGVTLGQDRRLVTQTARHAASADVTTDAVVEAVAHIDAAAVEAWLIEREAAIPLNAQTLIALDDAGVPSRVIDLLVALDNPQRFAIDRSARGGEVAEAERTALSREEQRRRASMRYYGARYRPGAWYGFDPYWSYYGYDPYMLRYGYGGFYGWGSYYSRPPAIIIVPGQPSQPGTLRGRMVRGRGYTAPGSSSGSASGASTTSSSSPAATSSGSSGSDQSGSSGRRARPTGGGGGGGSQN